jgi:hypothetical protein
MVLYADGTPEAARLGAAGGPGPEFPGRLFYFIFSYFSTPEQAIAEP